MPGSEDKQLKRSHIGLEPYDLYALQLSNMAHILLQAKALKPRTARLKYLRPGVTSEAGADDKS